MQNPYGHFTDNTTGDREAPSESRPFGQSLSSPVGYARPFPSLTYNIDNFMASQQPPLPLPEPPLSWDNVNQVSNPLMVTPLPGLHKHVTKNAKKKLPKVSKKASSSSNLRPNKLVGNSDIRGKGTLNSTSEWKVGMDGGDEIEKRRRRAERFSKGPSATTNSNDSLNEDFANLNAISSKSHKYDKKIHLVGRCQTLEKSYLRLTSEPNPDFIRPPNILQKTYRLLMEKYQSKAATYTYLCDQFKSMRQDLRVQMIENSFTIKVYQTHARIALENGDLGEFNQCQNRIMALFENATIPKKSYSEFICYSILYSMLTEDFPSISQLKLKLMDDGASEILADEHVKMIFELSNMKLVGNYHYFMKHYSKLHKFEKFLINSFLNLEKLNFLTIICKSYNQINLEFIKNEFNFTNIDETINFLREQNLAEFIISKQISDSSGKNNNIKILNSKGCRAQLIQNVMKFKKIDIKGQK
ncbi:YPR045C [Saccharomyces arboricola H-6]|uniref:YPR045C n=1 Tax=Saccharomyces arboricola (strain H-6 / AS 2.3317 / CBS 10644) TaxID=1160507 RepID=J8PY19_SACAR|nr:YPR045C [Saccharomyces arboricola H-6]